ncbi:MAG: DUF29 domain-containing protein [Deltaproteobacteria bacterium]|nr:DUF29 domain-containing protein [Deltaproteobacteria bacterium]
MSAISPKPSVVVPLYERDYYLWAQEQARALREHRPDQIDWENLAEEVDDLARRNADALEGQCETLIEHLLKIALASESIRKNNLRLWRASVRNARHKIGILLRRNPSLRVRSDELFGDAWPVGSNNALAKLDLEDEAIPEAPLFTFDQAVNNSFEPEILR